jgi:hypothetical protein
MTQPDVDPNLGKIIQELQTFLNNEQASRFEFPPMSSVDRKAVHTEAQKIGLKTSTAEDDKKRRYVVVTKSENSQDSGVPPSQRRMCSIGWSKDQVYFCGMQICSMQSQSLHPRSLTIFWNCMTATYKPARK